MRARTRLRRAGLAAVGVLALGAPQATATFPGDDGVVGAAGVRCREAACADPVPLTLGLAPDAGTARVLATSATPLDAVKFSADGGTAGGFARDPRTGTMTLRARRLAGVAGYRTVLGFEPGARRRTPVVGTDLAFGADGSMSFLRTVPDDSPARAHSVLFRLAKPGGAITRVADLPFTATGLTRSPDGSQYAFVVDVGHSGTSLLRGLARIAADGSGYEQLVRASGPQDNTAAPSFSPDGRQLAFVSEVGTSLELFDLTTGVRRQLRFIDAEPTTTVAWSPSGTRIALARWGSLVLVGTDQSLQTVIMPRLSISAVSDWQPLPR